MKVYHTILNPEDFPETLEEFRAKNKRNAKMKFRKKPVVIDAIQWDGTAECWNRLMEMGLRRWSPGEMATRTFYIETLEGKMKTSVGDWVIKGVNGEFYPCKPDIFEKTYEPEIE